MHKLLDTLTELYVYYIFILLFSFLVWHLASQGKHRTVRAWRQNNGKEALPNVIFAVCVRVKPAPFSFIEILIIRRGSRKYWTGGRNCINYQAEPGGANLFFGLTYKGKQGGVRRVIYMVNPRLIIYSSIHIKAMFIHIFLTSYKLWRLTYFSTLAAWCILMNGEFLKCYFCNKKKPLWPYCVF